MKNALSAEFQGVFFMKRNKLPENWLRKRSA